jgi:hypothetical protein
MRFPLLRNEKPRPAEKFRNSIIFRKPWNRFRFRPFFLAPVHGGVSGDGPACPWICGPSACEMVGLKAVPGGGEGGRDQASRRVRNCISACTAS